MKKVRIICGKIMFPPPLAVSIIALIAVPLTIMALRMKNFPEAIKYFTYLYSAYSLTVFILNFKKLVYSVTKLFKANRVYKWLESNPVTGLFLADFSFRGTVSLYQGLFVNTLFAVFKLITAFMYTSMWFGAVAAYYFITGIIKLILIKGMKKAKAYSDDERIIIEYKSYRICGILMFTVNVAMVGMAVQMIHDNQHSEYPGFIIYLSAMYTFYIMTIAVISLFKARKLNSPVLSASKALNFAAALMSVFALQTAMIARFGEDDAKFRIVANSITGGVVCIAPIVIAVFMIIKSYIKTKHINTL